MFLNKSKRRILRVMGGATLNTSELSRLVCRCDLDIKDIFLELERDGFVECVWHEGKRFYHRTHNVEVPQFSKKGIPVVYFVQSELGGYIKIGYSEDLEVRYDTLQAETPGNLTLLNYMLASIYHERHLHARFAKYRYHDEWYYPNLGLTYVIDNLEPLKMDTI